MRNYFVPILTFAALCKERRADPQLWELGPHVVSAVRRIDEILEEWTAELEEGDRS
jgi:hypothetical protein